MGCSESKSTAIKKRNVTKKKFQKEQITENSTHNHNIHQNNLRHHESMIDPKKPFIKLEPDSSKILSNEICIIVIETKEGRIMGTGFFFVIAIDLESFYCLMTNDHVINNESIDNNNIIYIKYEEYKTTNMKLDKNKIYIKSFIDEGLDITVVQILEEDNIPKKYFLEPESVSIINNNLINEEIYIPQYNE